IPVPNEKPLEAGPGASLRGRSSLLRRFRFGRTSVAIAVALALVAAAATAFALRSGGGSHQQAAMSGSAMTASGYPDAIEEDLLLAHTPVGIRSNCRRVPPIATSVFLRSVRCAQGAGRRDVVTYSRAHSGDALRAYFIQQVRSVGLAYPSRWACRGKQPAADEGTREGLSTHVDG